MRRRLLATLAALLVIAFVVVVRASSKSDSVEEDSISHLETSALGRLPLPPPKPRFTRTTYAASDLDGALPLLDKCKGPVAVLLGADRPVLIAEHDYCGGSAWMSKVKVGDAVKIGGDGVDDGIFVVTSLAYETRKEVTVGDLPVADAVLQTCVTKTKLVLVALDRFDPMLQS